MPVVSFLLDDNHVIWLKMKKDRYGVSMSLIIRDALDDEMRNEERFGETRYFKTKAEKIRAVEEDARG